MKLRFKKIQNLYLLYGIANFVMLALVLFVVILFHNKYTRLEQQINSIDNELVRIVELKGFSNDFFIDGFLSDNNYTQKQDSFLIEISNSRTQIQTIFEESDISDMYYSETVNALLLDYKSLEDQNSLLFKYLINLGNTQSGLYGKLIKAEDDFLLKVNDYTYNNDIIKQFYSLSNLLNLFVNHQSVKLSKDIEYEIKQISNLIDYIDDQRYDYVKLRIKDAFTYFTLCYQELAQQILTIGINKKIGLTSEIDLNFSRIVERLEISMTIIGEYKEKLRVTIFILIFSYILIFIILNSLVLKYISGLVKRFFGDIKRFITSLQKGELDNVDKSKHFEESHDLIKSLNECGQQIINSQTAITNLLSGKMLKQNAQNQQSTFFKKELIDLDTKLKSLEERLQNESHKTEKIFWVNEGIGKITDILRNNYDSKMLHTDELILMLIDFLKIPLGAIYIVDNKNIKLLSSFAYGKKKKYNKHIVFGEGIVGTAAAEKRTLLLTSIPQNYFDIISGFGKAKPRTVLISPIKLNEVVYGVIELASLNKFTNDDIEFIEEVCKTIAYSFAISKIYSETLIKLDNSEIEITQLKTENSSLSNDYSELNSSYRQVHQELSDSLLVMQSIDEIAMVVDLDLDGNVIKYNQGFDNFFKSIGVLNFSYNFKNYLVEINLNKNFDIEPIWKDLKLGMKHTGVQKILLFDKKYSFQQFFIPVQDSEGKVLSIKLIMFNLSH